MKRNLIALIFVILIILVVLSVADSLRKSGIVAPASPGSSQSLQGSGPGPGPSCGGCVGVADNGRTIDVKETDRVTLDLPSAGYDRSALSLSPADSFGETFGANAAPGDWVRTFQAILPGTTTLRVPALPGSGYQDYVLTLQVQ